MRRLSRILFAAVTVLSLVLAVFIAVLWVRSYTTPTAVDFNSGAHLQVASYGEGTLIAMYRWPEPFTPHPGGGASGGSTRSIIGDGSLGIAVMNVWTPRKSKLRGYIVTAPHWLAFAVALVIAAVSALPLLMRRRRAMSGRCPSCGYDLRATPDRCPECGAVAAPAPGA